ILLSSLIALSLLSSFFPYTTLFRSVDYGIPLGAIDFNWVGRIACSRQCVSTSLNGEALTRRKTKKSVILWTGWGVRTSVRFVIRSEEHTSELQSRFDSVCRLLLDDN